MPAGGCGGTALCHAGPAAAVSPGRSLLVLQSITFCSAFWMAYCRARWSVGAVGGPGAQVPARACGGADRDPQAGGATDADAKESNDAFLHQAILEKCHILLHILHPTLESQMAVMAQVGARFPSACSSMCRR